MKNLFLKDDNNDILAEVSINIDDNNQLYVVGDIDIVNYSNFLLWNQNKRVEIINDFNFVYNISDWFFYNYIEEKNSDTREEIENKIYKFLKDISIKFRISLTMD